LIKELLAYLNAESNKAIFSKSNALGLIRYCGELEETFILPPRSL